MDSSDATGQANTILADDRDTIREIGKRLRHARKQRNLTLEDVAGGAGLSKGFLSQFERGEAAASIGSLVRICSVLGISLSSLFDLPDAIGPIVTRRQDGGGDTSLDGRGIRVRIITPRAERRVEIREVTLEPGAQSVGDLVARDGDVAIAVVMSGTLEVCFAKETVRLHKGDSVSFDPSAEHSYSNPSAKVAASVILVHVPTLS
jgi:transcriptional regulator with XRE-family HTH domain